MQLGECQRLSVVGRRAFGIEPVGVARDVAEQAQGMGRGAGLTPSGFDRAIGQTPRLVKPAEQQTGATHRAVRPAAMADDPPRRLMVEELRALPDPVQGLARLAKLGQYPGGGRNRPRKMHGDVCGAKHRDPVFDL